MAFHIPFNQRATARQKPAPIYIGFEVQRPPRKKFNWWGFHGMWMSVASLFTAGFTSPVPLLISLVGLRRPGKKMATVGTIVSSLGIALATTMVVGTIVTHNHRVEARQTARYNKIVKKQVAETNALMAIAAMELEEFRSDIEVDDRFDIKANMLILKYVDPWEEELRFELTGDGLIRSAGPDKKFDTRDDITLELNPETESANVSQEATAEADYVTDAG